MTLLNVVNSSMMSTTYRFIAFELGKKENSLLNKVFNTCFSIHACFSILIIIFGIIIGDWYIENHLNVEVGKVSDALFIFHISSYSHPPVSMGSASKHPNYRLKILGNKFQNVPKSKT